MKTFEFQSPDGKMHTLEGPDNATPEQAFAILQQQLGSAANTGAPTDQLLAAQRTIESNNNPRAVSKAGAMGVAQFMPATARELGIDPFNVEQAKAGQAKMMTRLMKKYNGSEILAMQAYNWGEGNVDSFLKTGRGAKGQAMPRETQEYANKIIAKLPPKSMLQRAEPALQGFQEGIGGIQQGAERIMEKLGMMAPEDREAANIRRAAKISDYEQRRAAEGETGFDAGRFAGNIAPAFAFPQAKVAQGLAKIPHVAKGASRILAGGLQGGTAAGSMQTRTGDDQEGNALGGAAFGAAFPAVGAAGRAAFGGKPLNEAQQAVKTIAERFGITPRPSAIGGGNLARRIEVGANATLGGAKAFGAMADKNDAAISRGITNLFGFDEPAITTNVVKKIVGQIDDNYQNAFRHQAILPDAKLLIEDFSAIRANPAFKSDKKLAKRIIADLELAGPVGAEKYDKMRSALGAKAASAENNTQAEIYRAVRNALDDWAERRLPPENSALLKTARQHYKLYEQLKPAIDTTTGVVDTNKLATSLYRKENRAFMTGNEAANPLVPFAQMEEVTKRLPMPLAGMMMGTGGLAALGAMSGDNTVEKLGGGVAGLALPYLLTRGYLNPALRGAVSQGGRGMEKVLQASPYLTGGFFGP